MAARRTDLPARDLVPPRNRHAEKEGNEEGSQEDRISYSHYSLGCRTHPQNRKATGEGIEKAASDRATRAVFHHPSCSQ
jgi:hypothetical protein